MDLNDKKYTYYGGLYIKNIKAKNSFYSLSVLGNKDSVIEKG
jgi:hypothetical protein